MNRTKAFLCLLGNIAMAFGQEISLQVEHTAYLPYEPVYILAKYVGTEPIKMNPYFPGTTVSVTPAGATEERVFRPIIKADPPADGDVSAGGQDFVLNLSIDAFGWTCAKPGEYVVIVRTGTHTSDPVRFTVSEPQTRNDIDARNMIRDCQEFGSFSLFEGTKRFPQAIDVARKLAAGESAYRSAAREFLLKCYLKQTVTPDQVLHQPDWREAVKYLDPATDEMRHLLSRIGSLRLLKRARRIPQLACDFDGMEREINLISRKMGIPRNAMDKMMGPR